MGLRSVEHQEEHNEEMSQEASLGELFFRWRDYTPVPLVLLLLFVAKPTVLSATLGTLLIVLGELLRIYSVAFIGGISRTRKGSLGGHLVTDGPFRWVRNPLYCGNFIIVCGVAFFTSVFWFFLLALIGFAVQYYYIVLYEEKLLVDKFGEEFVAYTRAVPPWIPKRMPKAEEIDWPESFTAAIISEKRTLLAIVAVLVLLLLKA
jgi:protein-S-isoprenylcysteine O-methyltransferase Ste14